MADPGTLIPVDATLTHVDYADSVSSFSPLSRDIGSNIGTGSSEAVSSFEEPSEFGTDERMRLKELPGGLDDISNTCASTSHLHSPGMNEEPETSTKPSGNPSDVERLAVPEAAPRPLYPTFHARSPSWTEGVSSPAVRKMKVKDVSQYMLDAAKENPHLAQKLHDVLLESGVVAPANLFSEIYPEHSDVLVTVTKPPVEGKQDNKKQLESRRPRDLEFSAQRQFLPPLPHHGGPSRAPPVLRLENAKPGQGLGTDNVESGEGSGHTLAPLPDMGPAKFGKNVPVAAAAAAAAAVVASSMVAAVAKSNPDPKFDLPVAAAATATAAAVVATTAAVGKQYEQLDISPHSPGDFGLFNQVVRMASREADDTSHQPRGTDKEQDASQSNSEERTSDRSAGGDSAGSARSDMPFDDVADCEIAWEELTLGERIGLGMKLMFLFWVVYFCFGLYLGNHISFWDPCIFRIIWRSLSRRVAWNCKYYLNFSYMPLVVSVAQYLPNSLDSFSLFHLIGEVSVNHGLCFVAVVFIFQFFPLTNPSFTGYFIFRWPIFGKLVQNNLLY